MMTREERITTQQSLKFEKEFFETINKCDCFKIITYSKEQPLSHINFGKKYKYDKKVINKITNILKENIKNYEMMLENKKQKPLTREELMDLDDE